MAQHPEVGNLVRPAPATATGPPQSPQEQEKLTSDWLEFLQRPEVIAGLLQFGIDALQPAAPGRGTLAQIGAAVAGGGEAVGRVRAGRRERAEERRKAGLEERRVEVKEEGPKVAREEIVSREVTAKADRKARALISQNKIEAAGKVLEEDVRVRLEISENTQESAILNVASNMLIQRDKGILAGTLVGEAPQGLSTTGDLFELYKRLKRVAGGEEPFQEGDIPDEDMVRLLLGTPEEQAAAERAITRLPAEQQARIRSKVDLQRSLREEEEEAGALPKKKPTQFLTPAEMRERTRKAAEPRKALQKSRKALRTKSNAELIELITADLDKGVSLIDVVKDWGRKLGDRAKAARLARIAQRARP